MFDKSKAFRRLLSRTGCLLSALVCFIFACAALHAQLSSTATISGTVTDSSGAVVSNATVTITDLDTKVTAVRQSNSNGAFVFPGLPVDPYSLTVTSQGFANYKESGIILHPGTTASRNVTLQPKSTTEQVVVDATAVQVETVTPEVSGNVSSEQVATMPLNGRNFSSLAAVMPGVQNLSAGSAMGTGGRSTSNTISINGANTNTTFYALDGMWDENTGNMNAVAVLPNPDSLEEVRVFQNDYSVRYTIMGASVVLLQTKSGSSNFHGTAWEYLRNEDLNARNYFSTSIPPLKENIYGYNLGGPVFIPHHYNTTRDKTFFFWSQQFVKLHQGQSLTGTTPTAAQISGVFASSIPIYNPATSQPFPTDVNGNYLVTPLNTNSLALIKAVYPAPNYSKGALNYVNNIPSITNTRDDQIKIDHHINSRWSVMGEYLDERQTWTMSSMNSGTSGEVSNLNWEQDLTNNQLGQLSLTTLIGDNIVNSASISTNIYNVDLNLKGISDISQIDGYSESLPFHGELSTRIPSITVSGNGGVMPQGIPNSRPLHHAADLDDSIGDNLSWLKGKHYIQAGFNMVFSTKRQNINTNNAAGTNGGFTFNGYATKEPAALVPSGGTATAGNSLADFLLGYASNFQQASDTRRMYVHGLEVSPYIEDRITLTRRLTATVGFRAYHLPLPHADQTETLFDPTTYVASAAPTISQTGTIVTAGTNSLNGLITNGQNGVPQNFSNKHTWYFGSTIGFAYDVFGDGRTSIRGGYGLAHTRIFSNQDCSFNCGNNPPYITSTNLTNVNFPNAVSSGSTTSSIQSLASADMNIGAAQINSYSLGVQHEFPKSWIASVTGAGSSIRHLWGTWNYNQPQPYGQYDFNPNVANSSYSPYYYAPYTGYANINTLASRQGSNWTALEATLKHPVSNSVFLTVAYTWSHALGNWTTGGTYNMIDVYHPSRYYGNVPNINTPQMGSAAVIWTIPWFKNASNRFEKTVLGGWKLSDMTLLRSGLSLDMTYSGNNSGYPVRPDVTGASLYGDKSATSWLANSTYLKAHTNVSNPFTAPVAGYFGNANIGIIRGPGMVDFDMALYKTFPIFAKHQVEFRAEAFNVMNHTNFSAVSTAYNSSSFGQVTSAQDPRIMEVALRYQF
jgi:hypothetical protein